MKAFEKWNDQLPKPYPVEGNILYDFMVEQRRLVWKAAFKWLLDIADRFDPDGPVSNYIEEELKE